MFHRHRLLPVQFLWTVLLLAGTTSRLPAQEQTLGSESEGDQSQATPADVVFLPGITGKTTPTAELQAPDLEQLLSHLEAFRKAHTPFHLRYREVIKVHNATEGKFLASIGYAPGKRFDTEYETAFWDNRSWKRCLGHGVDGEQASDKHLGGDRKGTSERYVPPPLLGVLIEPNREDVQLTFEGPLPRIMFTAHERKDRYEILLDTVSDQWIPKRVRIMPEAMDEPVHEWEVKHVKAFGKDRPPQIVDGELRTTVRDGDKEMTITTEFVVTKALYGEDVVPGDIDPSLAPIPAPPVTPTVPAQEAESRVSDSPKKELVLIAPTVEALTAALKNCDGFVLMMGERNILLPNLHSVDDAVLARRILNEVDGNKAIELFTQGSDILIRTPQENFAKPDLHVGIRFTRTIMEAQEHPETVTDRANRNSVPLTHSPDGVAYFPDAGDGTRSDAAEPQVASPANVRVFALKNARAADARRIIEQLYKQSLSVAGDERTNSLIVRSTDESMDEVQALLTRLDDAAGTPNSTESASGPALQSPNQRGATMTVPAVGLTAQSIDLSSRDSNQQSSTFSLSIGFTGHNTSELRQQYDALERQARSLSDQLRKPLPDPASGEKLKSQLRDTVSQAFETRQKLQRAELAEFAKRVQGIQQSIEMRDKISQQIIERRIQELLDPNIKWDGPATSNSRGTQILRSEKTDSTDIRQPNPVLGKVQVLTVMADWCLPCREMEPVLQDLEGLGYAIRRADLTLHPEIARKYSVDRVPTLILLAENKEVERFTGLTGLYQLQSAINRALSKLGVPSNEIPAVTPDGSRRSATVTPGSAESKRLPTLQVTIDQAKVGKLERLTGPGGMFIDDSDLARLDLPYSSTNEFHIRQVPDHMECALHLEVTVPDLARTAPEGTAAKIKAVLLHNVAPLALTSEDLRAACGGSPVTKVIYVPYDASEFKDSPLSAVVSTRLDPSEDPIKKAESLGTLVVVARVSAAAKAVKIQALLFDLDQKAEEFDLSKVQHDAPDDLDAMLKEAAAKGKVTILSRPQMITRLHQESLLLIGQSVPLATNGDQVTSSRDVGVKVGITPREEDGKPVLKVAFDFSRIDPVAPTNDPDSTPFIQSNSGELTVRMNEYGGKGKLLGPFKAVPGKHRFLHLIVTLTDDVAAPIPSVIQGAWQFAEITIAGRQNESPFPEHFLEELKAQSLVIDGDQMTRTRRDGTNTVYAIQYDSTTTPHRLTTTTLRGGPTRTQRYIVYVNPGYLRLGSKTDGSFPSSFEELNTAIETYKRVPNEWTGNSASSGESSDRVESSTGSGLAPAVETIVAGLDETNAAIQNLSVTTDYIKRQRFLLPFDSTLEMKLTTKAVIDSKGRSRNETDGQQVNIEPDGRSARTYRGRWVGVFQNGVARQLTSYEDNPPTASIDSVLSWHGVDPREFTTHYQNKSVTEIIRSRGAQIAERTEWDGRPVTVVETTPRGKKEQRRYRFWIDTERRIVVRRAIVVRYAEGQPWQEYARIESRDHQQIRPGLWLPGKVKYESVDVSPDLKPEELSWSYEGTNRDWQVNRELPADTFELPFPDDAPVSDHRPLPDLREEPREPLPADSDAEKISEASRTPHPVSHTIGKLVLVFFQDKSRRAVPCVPVRTRSESFVITMGPATVVPDGTPHAIDRCFVEWDGSAPIEVVYDNRSTEEFSLYRLATDAQLPESVQVIPGSTLDENAELQGGFDPRLEIGAPLTALTMGARAKFSETSVHVTAVNVMQNFRLATHNVDRNYKALFAVDASLPEGTPIFHDSELMGLTILGSRFIGEEASRSFVVPATRLREFCKTLTD